MTKRKLMLVALSLCMVAILAMGGTLAYLTDSETATNTFTVGDVEINIDEFVYKDGKWYPFENNGFKLNPIENKQGYDFQNKIVNTFNTSSSKNDAYIRTIVLFEKNNLITDVTKNEDGCCFPGLHYGFHNEADPMKSGADNKMYYGCVSTKLSDSVTYNGKEYWVAVFTENGGDPIPYDAALYSLARVWMDKNVTSETIKGWGDDVEVIVCSQAIQAEGLTHEQAMAELGEVNATNLAKWMSEAGNAVINNWSDKANNN